MKFLQAAEIGNGTNTIFYALFYLRQKNTFFQSVWRESPIYNAAMEAINTTVIIIRAGTNH